MTRIVRGQEVGLVGAGGGGGGELKTDWQVRTVSWAGPSLLHARRKDGISHDNLRPLIGQRVVQKGLSLCLRPHQGTNTYRTRLLEFLDTS
jgi:hypothetical protein